MGVIRDQKAHEQGWLRGVRLTRRSVKKTFLAAAAAVAMVALSACGGGGGHGAGGGKAWGTAQLIETDNVGNAFVPQVAVAPNGNAVAVWAQSDTIRDNIWANTFNAATGTWGTAALIEVNSGTAGYVQVAMAPNGNAVAVWSQTDGTRFNIWANTYNAMTGAWGIAQMIETDNAGNASVPQVAVDPNGHAVAVWSQSDGTRDNIWANSYNATNGLWGTAQLIELNNTGSASDPHVAMGATGNAVVVWTHSDGVRFNIWANRNVAGFWGVPQLIELDNTGSAFGPQVAVDANDNAVAVWTHFDGLRFNIQSNRYAAASGLWGTAQLIETDNAGGAFDPQVAVDPNGNAVAVWYQSDGFRDNIWANTYNGTSGLWGTAQLIETDNIGDAQDPQVAISAGGNAVAVWNQFDGTRTNILANHFSFSSGAWGAPQLIESDPGAAYYPQVAVGANGDAMAVWTQLDGIRENIWANRFH